MNFPEPQLIATPLPGTKTGNVRMDSTTQGAKPMSRLQSPLAALPAKISRSGFPDERIFVVETFDGKQHTGYGPSHYFWDDNGKPLGADLPTEDQEIKGIVAVQVLKIEDGRALVEVPNGSVAWVSAGGLLRRPTEINLDVPVGS
jgi:hypothetical protein